MKTGSTRDSTILRTLILCAGSISALTLLTGCPALETPDLTPDPDTTGTHVIRLVHISDPQIVDEESPARSVRTDDLISVSWRPQEAYGIHTLDATLQRINTIHERGAAEGRPVDFVVMTGDLADLAQFNELQWFMDTMDGKVVTPDSGVADGAARDRLEARNPKLPYAATGLDPAIPWYTCYGNHDALATGNFAIDRGASNPEEWFAPLFPIVADVIGYHLLDPAWDFMLPTADRSPAIVTGSGPPLGPDGLQVDLAALEAGPIAPDPARRFLSQRDFIAMHLESTGSPAGHGFSQAALSRGETWFSVRPLPDVPVRLIVFDTVAAGAHYGLPLYYGALTRRHLENFIIPALDAATEAGEWIVLASHHPPDDFAIPFPDATVSTNEFHAAVSRYPGVVLHLVGHTHRNRARTIPGTFPYIEIETSAIIDFPQEGRILDLFVADDGRTIRIESTLFSHVEAPTTFSAESYRRALLDWGLRKASPSGAPGQAGESARGQADSNPAGAAGDRDVTWVLTR